MPLMITLRDEILSDMESIAKDPKLYPEKNFNVRIQAIDFIEFHIIDRINVLTESGEPSDQLLELKQWAGKLRCRLEDLNTHMFKKLRTNITAGIYRGNVLMKLIEEYLAGDPSECLTKDDTGYDHLDIFLNGLLTHRNLPAETRNREPEMVHYQKTPVRIILEIIKRAEFQPKDVFVDLGSGLGQVVILVHLLMGVSAKGVEFEPAFCEYARSCAAELNVNSVEFINTDARDADYSPGTVFFMYTPFVGKMLQEVLERLRIEAKLRIIKIFTYGPCTEELARQDWLINRNEIHEGPGTFGEFLSF
jgi:precorrin-6B methylase 2